MQLYAKTASNSLKMDLISAAQAQRRHDYFCPECHAVVRLRAGEQRLKHFYHLAKSTHCRQQNKSLEHIHTQSLIQASIGPERCALEVAFPAISRIADAVWEEEKLIFEVQCSPMTAHEARARIADYARVGYQVVFILHDKRFNQHRLSALEAALQNRPCYFSNISADGTGILYDQFAVLKYGCRSKRLAKLPIAINRPLRFADVGQMGEMGGVGDAVYALFHKRLHACTAEKKHLLYFEGDLFDLAGQTPHCSYIEKALHIQQSVTGTDREPVMNEMYAGIMYIVHTMCTIHTTARQFFSILWRALLEKCASK